MTDPNWPPPRFTDLQIEILHVLLENERDKRHCNGVRMHPVMIEMDLDALRIPRKGLNKAISGLRWQNYIVRDKHHALYRLSESGRRFAEMDDPNG